MASNLTPVNDYARPGVRAVVLNEAGEVLLLKRPDGDGLYPGTWNLPGGAKEDNESHAEGALRELVEETGLSAQPADREVPFTFPGGCGIAYLMQSPSGELRPAEREVAEAAWFSPDALPDPLFPTTFEILAALGLVEQPRTDTAIAPDVVRIDEAATIERGVSRLDRGTFRAPVRTEEGFLKVDGYASRTGVLVYITPEGNVRRELVLPEHLFDPSSLATLTEKPVTREHPAALLTAQTAKEHTRGWTGATAERDGDFVKIPLTITDAELIEEMVRGDRRELSAGYKCDVVMQAGKWRGLEYDAIQTNRRYNHLAAVRRGRAGAEVRIRMDAAEEITPHDSEEETPMEVTIKLDGIEYKVPAVVAQAINAVQAKHDAAIATATARADAAEAKVATELARADAAESKLADTTGKLATETARADAAESKATTLETQRMDAGAIQEAVKVRTELITKAAGIVPADTKLDALDNDGIKAAVVKAVYPTTNLDGKPAGYLDALYERALEDGPKLVDGSKTLAKAAGAARNDAAAGDKVEAAREQLRKDSAEGWQKPIGVSVSK